MVNEHVEDQTDEAKEMIYAARDIFKKTMWKGNDRVNGVIFTSFMKLEDGKFLSCYGRGSFLDVDYKYPCGDVRVSYVSPEYEAEVQAWKGPRKKRPPYQACNVSFRLNDDLTAWHPKQWVNDIQQVLIAYYPDVKKYGREAWPEGYAKKDQTIVLDMAVEGDVSNSAALKACTAKYVEELMLYFQVKRDEPSLSAGASGFKVVVKHPHLPPEVVKHDASEVVLKTEKKSIFVPNHPPGYWGPDSVYYSECKNWVPAKGSDREAEIRRLGL